MRQTWIQTLEGRKLEPLNIQADQVGSIDEIAQSLSRKFRFTGQTREPYTVAQHCVLGSRLVAPAYAGAFLLHELSEVYLPDIASPLKPFVFVTGIERHVAWVELEHTHTRIILAALGLSALEPLIHSDEVKSMDLSMLMTEKRDLMGVEPEPWGIGANPIGRINYTWAPALAHTIFLSRFAEIFS